MTNIDMDKLMQLESVRTEAETRVALEGKSLPEIEAYAFQEMKKVPKDPMNGFRRRCCIDFLKQEEFDFLYEQVSSCGHFYRAFREVLANDAVSIAALPKRFLVFFLEIELKVRPKPTAKKRKTHTLRDEVIWQCIWDIERFTDLKPTRGTETRKGTSICDIVARNHKNLTYDAASSVWKARPVRFRK